MNLDKLFTLEIFEQFESQILVYHQILDKVTQMKRDYHISEETYELLSEKYTNKYEEAKLKMQIFLKQQSEPEKLIHKALSLHALGIEKQYLKEMFTYNELPENIYHYLLDKINNQIARVKATQDQIR